MAGILENTLKPVSLKDRVADLIKEAILSGRLQSGARIVELQLAKELGVATTSVREALFDLEHKGFVTRLVNKGVYVTQLTIEDIRKIYRVRMELEGLAVELGKEHVSATDIDRVQGIVDKMESAARKGNMKGFNIADLEFHRVLWSLSNNRYLIDSLERLVVPLFAFYLMKTRRNPKELIVGAHAHQKILDALSSKGARQARKVTEEVMQFFWEQQKLLLDIPGAESANPLS